VNLIADWKRVLRRAWTVRLNIAACLLYSAELVVGMLTPQFPSGRFVAAAAIVSVLAGIARVIEQKNLRDGR